LLYDCKHITFGERETVETPIIIGLAVSSDGSISSSSECTHIGDLRIKCDDGSSFTTTCFYNPNASDTIISPQAIIDESTEFTSWSQSGRKFGQPSQLNFIGPNGTKTLTLQQYNGLYFISSASYSIVDESRQFEEEVEGIPTCQGLTANKVDIATQTNFETRKPKRQAPRHKKYTPVSRSKALESETWYLRLGGCNKEQLDKLSANAIGLPANFEWHPFHILLTLKNKQGFASSQLDEIPTRWQIVDDIFTWITVLYEL
jgi:hypothetical protein